MLRRAALLMFLGGGLLGCPGQNPDYVVAPLPPQCDVRSRLVRRGYPENLEELFVGNNCTVAHTKTMRGPDFSRWLSRTGSPWKSCEAPVEIWFWVERDMLGEITRVHFCPVFCAWLLEEMRLQLKQDLICEPDAGMAGSPAAGGTAGAATVDAGTAGSTAGTPALPPGP